MTKQKKQSGLWKEASFTIEASYLVPVILFLLVLIGTAALYLHDRCVSCFDAQAVTICGRMLALGNSGEEETLLESYLSEEGTKGLLMTTNAEASGSIGTWKITASVDGNISNAFSDLFSSWGWPVFDGFSESETDVSFDPCTVIRSARILLGEISGGDQ